MLEKATTAREGSGTVDRRAHQQPGGHAHAQDADKGRESRLRARLLHPGGKVGHVHRAQKTTCLPEEDEQGQFAGNDADDVKQRV